VKDEDYYLKHNELMRILREYEVSRLSFSKTELENEMLGFAIYFLIKMLKYYCIVVNEERRTGTKIEKVLYEDVMNWLKLHPEIFEKAPAVRIFYNLLLLNQREHDVDQFNRVQSLLAENKDFVTKDDVRIAHRYLHAYCQHCCKCLDSEFSIECFKLVKAMIEEGDLIAKDRYINEHTFVCIATAALQADEVRWVEEFIEKYKGFLPFAVRDNTYKYTMALVHFHTGRYQSSLKLLNAVEDDNIYHYIRTRNLQLKISYELGDIEAVIENLEAIRKQLKKNKTVPVYVKTRFNNYLEFFGKLCAVRLRTDGAPIEQLASELNESKDVEDKFWLLGKVKELVANP